MRLLRRLRNLWAWSGVDPRLVPHDVVQASLGRAPEAKIISHLDPTDEVYEAIRQENPGQA